MGLQNPRSRRIFKDIQASQFNFLDEIIKAQKTPTIHDSCWHCKDSKVTCSKISLGIWVVEKSSETSLNVFRRKWLPS